MSRGHALYRFFDADDRLLYVGITCHLPTRWTNHSKLKSWWQDVARASVEHFPSRAALEDAERRAIAAENPLYNVMHNRGKRIEHPPPPVAPHREKGRWYFKTRYGTERWTDLALYWEVNGDPISDDYCADVTCPDFMSADDLLEMWARRHGEDGGDVKVWWFVTGRHGGSGVFEAAPFGPHYFYDEEDPKNWGFLAHYTWPVDAETGERLNWMSLPVQDKLWRPRHQADKGGFIQEATGWKPSAYTPYVNSGLLLGGMPRAYRKAVA